MLMIAERAGGALFSSKDKDSMKEMDEELATVINDFLNAVNVEALSLGRRIGRRPFVSLSHASLLISFV